MQRASIHVERAITNANFVGGNLNQINLLDARTFIIAAGTTTTVRPTVEVTILGPVTSGIFPLVDTKGRSAATAASRTSTARWRTPRSPTRAGR